MADRAYAALLRRQERHAEAVALLAGNPAGLLAEQIRYLRSVLAMFTDGDHAASPDAAREISQCSANLTGLLMGRLMEQEAPR